MMNYTGLFTPYKLNRPLTRQEKDGQFRQGRRRNVQYIMDENSVVRMNSVYLETVCKYYSGTGIASSMIAVLYFGFLIMFVFAFARSVYNSHFSWTGFAFALGFISFFLYFLGKLLRKEWFRKTHYPIRFNRKNQMIYVYQVNGQVLSAPWAEVFFTRATPGGAIPSWGIDGHILAQDGETVVNTFSLAVSVRGSSKLLSEYWEFIRCYMEEDCVEDLAELVALCPPVENRRESFTFGLQYLMKMSSRLEWIFLPVMLPLDLLAGVARWVAMQTSAIPQWPQAVQDACASAPDDPVNVSAANNPRHLWRYVLANEAREEYEARYARQTAANNRIRAKLAERYGKKTA
ncbi:DUF6708 domain-containing protein [Tenebrionicola larvae]|jgi:hypothetical protein|uniref:DUF6708 domain-containing protein n=1 Tax=Tenebrionicola larvae TaxID=2815733 RepID=A0A949Q3D1_9ENTR|nr:DUF6708 domain-containing protein [Tenebrionicola larvae]MBV5095946.1 hypothetical protein [Tenebrionicola larvae]